MANFSNQIGIGGKPIGPALRSGRRAKYQTPCSEFTNVGNTENIANSGVALNKENVLNLENVLNEIRHLGTKT